MTSAVSQPRRARLRISLAAFCLCAFGAPALSQDFGDAPSRVLQIFGIGGKKDDSARSATPPASEPQPAAAAQPKSDSPPKPNPFANSDSGTNEGKSRVLQTLLRFGRPRESDPKANGITSCPEIVVDGGGAELRSPPGADATNVRYQLTIGNTARDCALVGDDIAVRVGVEGAAILGPAGQSGAYSGNLRIALRRKSDDRLFSEKTHRVGATIPAGAARADFTLLVDDLSAPFISAKAADDYEVVMSFVPGGAEGAARPARRGRNGG
jgi:hypothetical protein